MSSTDSSNLQPNSSDADLTFKEIQVIGATEKSIYELFFSHHGRLFEDVDLKLYLGVFGLEDYRTYECDKYGVLPKWYICPFESAADSDSNVVMELRFVDSFARGVIVQFVWREGKQQSNAEHFVQKLIDRIKQVAEVLDIATSPSSKSIETEGKRESLKPWEKIPDHLWDRVALEMWHNGHTNREIGQKVSVTPEAITNRLSELRKQYGEEVVPKDGERRKKLIQKSHDTG